MKLGTIMLLCLFAWPLQAQTIQITGGDSSILQAVGGTAHLYFQNSETSVSGGILAGHVYGSINEGFRVHDWSIKAGSMFVPFSFATDYGSAHIQLATEGIEAIHATQNSSLTLFGGTSAQHYQLPFFTGSKPSTPTFLLSYRRKLSKRWATETHVEASDRQTAIQSISFLPLTHLDLSAAAGIGSNALFCAGRISYDDANHWKAQLNWTHHSPDFRRITLPYQTVTENSGLNAGGAFRSKRYSISVDRENVLSQESVATPLLQSTVTSAATGVKLGIASANVSMYFGNTNHESSRGQSASGTLDFGRVSSTTMWYHTAASSQAVEVLTEKISRRISLSQFIQAHDINVGGSYTSNLVTGSVGYVESFYPVLGLFEKTLSAQVNFQLPNAMKIVAGTLSTPDGHVKWTAYASKFTEGPMQGGTGRVHFAKYFYAGRFVDEKNQPVLGALQIGKEIVFADNDGRFVLPTNHKKAQSIVVVPDQFIAPGNWTVVSAPVQIDADAEATIVVRRK